MRGVAGGEDNVRRLRAYLTSLANEGRGLPSWDGRPNLRVVATACGFDRGIFYSNQDAKMLLDEAITRLGLDKGASQITRTAFEDARIQAEVKGQSDRRTKALEDELLRLRAENAQLRQENDRFRALRALMADTGRMP